jgi:ribosomal protein S18 acetylase RimI-like enzyme
MKKREIPEVETFLKSRERLCVAACAKFLKRGDSEDQIWILPNPGGGISALIIRSGQNLLPVFRGKTGLPVPQFLGGFWGPMPVHSVQGLKDETIALEYMLEKAGRKAAENIDYELMSLDRPPLPGSYSSGPRGLILRKPAFTDMDALAALQAGYEREEVLPRNAEFSAAVSRLNTEQIAVREQILTAELNGRLIGKINTSAASFTRLQVGGVYVHPDCRGLGIARRMTAEFVSALIAQGKGVSLFVKKANPAARSIYLRLGFQVLADYRISYY